MEKHILASHWTEKSLYFCGFLGGIIIRSEYSAVFPLVKFHRMGDMLLIPPTELKPGCRFLFNTDSNGEKAIGQRDKITLIKTPTN